MSIEQLAPQLDDRRDLVADMSGPVEVRVPRRRMPVRKRMFDVAVALPAALVLTPVMVALGAASSLCYRESPTFTQERLGAGGRTFKFWKIRTLPRIVPDTADKYQLRSLELPRFARVLRRRHLDELPQLWQVVAGQMSLVGPRPEMPTLSATFDPDFVADRLSVRPGLTGLWQISIAARGLIGEAEEWDRHYIEHYTLRLDLWIAMRTWHAMVRLEEISDLAEIPRWTGAAERTAD
jgi:lipopolysaccharide/colanic/teichoic acid biosynthesis glycosyltransferase